MSGNIVKNHPGSDHQKRWVNFDIHGLVKMRICKDHPGAYSVCKSFEPFQVEEIDKADLTLTDGNGMSGQYSFGTTAYKFLPGSTYLNKYDIKISFEREEIILSASRDLTPYVMPIVQWILLCKGATFIHGASVSVEGKGVLMPAWGGTGKTSAVMELLKINGSAFMSDDISIIHKENKVFSFPKPFFIYPYHKNIFPHLFKNKPKFIVPPFMSNMMAGIRQAVRPLLSSFPKVERFCRKFTPEHMQVAAKDALPDANFADSANISLILFLERYNGSSNTVDELSVEDAKRKVVGNLFFELGDNARELMMACGATGFIGLEDWFGRMEDVVVNLLKKHQLYRLRMIEMTPEETGKVIASHVCELLANI